MSELSLTLSENNVGCYVKTDQKILTTPSSRNQKIIR